MEFVPKLVFFVSIYNFDVESKMVTLNKSSPTSITNKCVYSL